jgi:hypothetical protein
VAKSCSRLGAKKNLVFFIFSASKVSNFTTFYHFLPLFLFIPTIFAPKWEKHSTALGLSTQGNIQVLKAKLWELGSGDDAFWYFYSISCWHRIIL